MRIIADLRTCGGTGMWEAVADRYVEVGDDGRGRLLDDHPRDRTGSSSTPR